MNIFPIGDQAVTISVGETISLENHHKIIGMMHWLRDNSFPGLLDIVVAYSSLTVIYDIYTVRSAVTTETVFDFIHQILMKAYTASVKRGGQKRNLKRIPVCYSDPYAPDMQFICDLKKLSPQEVIALHTSSTYHVYMIGFLPGFPYMAHVNGTLVVPRRESPRTKVEAGSVGLAGEQTGIYPIISPGGWQIIGRTPLPIFSKHDTPPVFFEPGDEVQFYSITPDEFVALSR